MKNKKIGLYTYLSSVKRIKHAKQVDELEQKVDATKAKLKELGAAGDDAWEQLKEGVESAWGALSAAIQNAAAKLKGLTFNLSPACVWGGQENEIGISSDFTRAITIREHLKWRRS